MSEFVVSMEVFEAFSEVAAFGFAAGFFVVSAASMLASSIKALFRMIGGR